MDDCVLGGSCLLFSGHHQPTWGSSSCTLSVSHMTKLLPNSGYVEPAFRSSVPLFLNLIALLLPTVCGYGEVGNIEGKTDELPL